MRDLKNGAETTKLTRSIIIFSRAVLKRQNLLDEKHPQLVPTQLCSNNMLLFGFAEGGLVALTSNHWAEFKLLCYANANQIMVFPNEYSYSDTDVTFSRSYDGSTFKGILLGFQKLKVLVWSKNALTMEEKGP